MSNVEHLRTPSYFNEIDTCILSVLLKRHKMDVKAFSVGKKTNRENWVDIIYNGKLPEVMGEVFKRIRKIGIRNYCGQMV